MRLIGERIAELRFRRGMSLRHLSAESGVSVAFLSEVERGVAGNISVLRLAWVAGGLGVSLADLLDENRKVLRRTCPGCHGTGVIETLPGNDLDDTKGGS